MKNKTFKNFRSSLNKFADLAHEEFKARHSKNWIDTNPVNVNYELLNIKKKNASNDGKDWRKVDGVVSPVRQEGNCGSDYAIAALGAVEGTSKIFGGQSQVFSVQQIIDCSKRYGNFGCEGGSITGTFNYITDYGVTTESQYPYVAKDESCKTKVGVFKTKGFVNVPSKSSGALENACDIQPVALAMEADALRDYEGGVYDDKACGTEPDEGALLVGYTDDYWIVKNSWGSDWGEFGYIRLKRDTIPDKMGGICGILIAPSYPKLN